MKFLLDLGNSRVKWAHASGGGLALIGAFAHEPGTIPLAELDAAVGAYVPEAVWVASVAGSAATVAIGVWARQRWGIEARLARVERQAFGLVCGYHDPGQLGVDRWLALVAARSICRQSLCVVDAGTALTIDALSRRGRHLGGVILPGLALMRRALATGTGSLPTVTGDRSPAIAASTPEAIIAGTEHAACGAIERFHGAVTARLHESPKLLLTGGDAPVLAELLNLPGQHEPDLVLHGLARFAEG